MGDANKMDGKEPSDVDSAIARSTTVGQAQFVKTATAEQASDSITGAHEVSEAAARQQNVDERAQGAADGRQTSAGASRTGNSQTSTQPEKTGSDETVTTNSQHLGTTRPSEEQE
jgi:hypothetical protein